MSEMTHEWLKRVSREERRATGKAVRDTLPLAGLAEVGATMAGRDPVALIGARDAGRLEKECQQIMCIISALKNHVTDVEHQIDEAIREVKLLLSFSFFSFCSFFYLI